jgi:D-methionine transport system permease protein
MHLFNLLVLEFLNTLYMIAVSAFLTLLFGLPLGTWLALLQREGGGVVYKTTATLVNFVRATPFAIFIILVMPLTRMIVGTTIGTTAAIVPLALGSIPFFARQVQATLASLANQKFELAFTCQATTWQTISHILIPESLPSLVRDFTLTVVTLISYSALAGIVGGGGLGKLAIQYGYQRYDFPMMFWTLAVLVLLVGCVQYVGECLAGQIEKKRGLR